MSESICAWCDPHPNRPGNHTICIDCLDARYAREQDDVLVICELAEEGAYAVTAQQAAREYVDRIQAQRAARSFTPAFNTFCVALAIVGLMGFALWPL